MSRSNRNESSALTVYKEPINTPGVIPAHLKRAATHDFPLLEIVQRCLVRLRPDTTLEVVLAAIALWKASKPVYEHVKRFLLWAFTSEVTIPEYDPVARDVMMWMSAKVMANVSTTNAMLVTGDMQDAGDNLYRQMMMDISRTGRLTQQSDEVQCLPPIGKRIFWIGFRPFLFARVGGKVSFRHSGSNSTNQEGQLENAITITTLGWSLKPLQGFVKACYDFKIENKTGTTTVHFLGGSRSGYGPWRSVTKAVRKMDTIDMDEEVKIDLIKDADYYYSAESKKFFADCGIPYRRGYLFHGPPGTGKTSFSAALAGHLNCDIYMVNLASSDISDSRLHSVFLALPRKCVVVIEDIDSAGIDREQQPKPPKTPLPPASQSQTQPQIPPGFPSGMVMPPAPLPRRRNEVTLSGLLNAIDGNASAEGRLLVMTSNNPEALDPALTRPGRIDKRVHFGKMGQHAARGIFLRLIGRAALAHDSSYTTAQMEDFAAQFAAKIPANTFTPAQLQNFLQTCRGSPETALAGINAWMEKNRPSEEELPDKQGELRKAKKKTKTKGETRTEPAAAEGMTNGFDAAHNLLTSGLSLPLDDEIFSDDLDDDDLID